MKLRDRLSRNWNFNRILFLALGTGIVISSIASDLLLGMLPGAYYTFMGISGTGCAAGNCGVPFTGESNDEHD